VQARGGKPVLNDRFIDIETQLADEANQRESSVNLLQQGLDTKVGKGENESITMGMLSPDIKQAINDGTWDINVNTSDLEDGAATFSKRGRLGEPCEILLMGDYPNVDTSSGKITFKDEFRVINGRNYITMPANTVIDFSSGFNSSQIILMLNTKTKVISRVTVSQLDTISDDNILFCVISNVAGFGIRDIHINCDYSINGFKPEDYRQSILLKENIIGTTKKTIFHASGALDRILHRLDGVNIREDKFVFDGDVITETRRLVELPGTVKLTHNLDLMETEVE